MELVWSRITPHLVQYLKEKIETYLRENPVDAARIVKLGGSSCVAESDGQMIVDLMRSRLLGYDSRSQLSPPFIASFTTHSTDSDQDEYHRFNGMLSQWRAYGGDGGVALVFDSKGLEALLKREYELYHLWPCLMGDVVYDKKDFDVERQFPQLFHGLKEYSQSFIQNDRTAGMRALSERISPILPSIVGRFKHGAFREERECRIVVGVMPESLRDELAKESDRSDRVFKKIHYRKGQYKAIPYIRLFEDLGEVLPIIRIVVGPCVSQIVNLETVKKLVETRDIVVKASDIPYVASS